MKIKPNKFKNSGFKVIITKKNVIINISLKSELCGIDMLTNI